MDESKCEDCLMWPCEEGWCPDEDEDSIVFGDVRDLPVGVGG